MLTLKDIILWKKIAADKVDKDSNDMNTTTKELPSDYCEYSICVFTDVGIGTVHQKILMEENFNSYLDQLNLEYTCFTQC